VTFLTAEGQRKKIPFEYYGVQEGLPESSATVFLQDRQGYIWVGTQNGLLKYDGYEFQLFQYGDSDSTANPLMVSNVSSLCEDHVGKIWIGGVKGDASCAVFDPETGLFTNFIPDTTDSLTINFPLVWFIYEDSRKDVWFITRSRSLRINQLERYDREGNLYFGSTKDFIWAMNSSRDTAPDLFTFLRDFGLELFEDSPIRFQQKGMNEECRLLKKHIEV
jgi:ligand-binding sensor domain-containing protein